MNAVVGVLLLVAFAAGAWWALVLDARRGPRTSGDRYAAHAARPAEPEPAPPVAPFPASPLPLRRVTPRDVMGPYPRTADPDADLPALPTVAALQLGRDIRRLERGGL